MSPLTEIAVGGFVPLSTVDWPGQLAATVFTRGCPWDCPYCHNPHLLSAGAGAGDPEAAAAPVWADVIGLLQKRVGLLDAVVFSGGEPLAQAALPAAVTQVRDLGFTVGLHTAGSVPAMLEAVLPLVDWIGFDVKAPFADYDRITRSEGSGERALASLRMIVASGTDFEARTTVHPDLLSRDDLSRLASDLEREGVGRWAIQAYRAEGTRPGLAPNASIAESLPDGLAGRFDFTLR